MHYVIDVIYNTHMVAPAAYTKRKNIMNYAIEKADALKVVVEGLMIDTFNPRSHKMFMEAIREDALYNCVDTETFIDAIESVDYAALGKEIYRAVYNYCHDRANALASARFDDRDRIRDSGSNYLRINHENF